uniref:Uncharacterized protein n=1 Tax=Romanomermis culicivorax TaxID=13658 RepID=A0A915J4J9_ROMCU
MKTILCKRYEIVSNNFSLAITYDWDRNHLGIGNASLNMQPSFADEISNRVENDAEFPESFLTLSAVRPKINFLTLRFGTYPSLNVNLSLSKSAAINLLSCKESLIR